MLFSYFVLFIIIFFSTSGKDTYIPESAMMCRSRMYLHYFGKTIFSLHLFVSYVRIYVSRVSHYMVNSTLFSCIFRMRILHSEFSHSGPILTYRSKYQVPIQLSHSGPILTCESKFHIPVEFTNSGANFT